MAELRCEADAPILWHGDCMEQMKQIPDGSVDLVLNDPPFGCTANKWDHVLPLDALWAEYDRVLKPNGAVVLFACGTRSEEPFLAKLIMSNPKDFRYTLVYQKNNHSDGTKADKRPLRIHEDILVFYKEQCTYNPQMSTKKSRVSKNFGLEGGDLERYPTTVLPVFKRESGLIHPTQKPVALLEWLIKTYTNRFEVVLDNTMGSGSTGVACVRTQRSFIGIEADDEYFDKAKKRIEREDGSSLEAEDATADVQIPALLPIFDPKDFMGFVALLSKNSIPEHNILNLVVIYLNRYFKIIQDPTYMVVELNFKIVGNKKFTAGHNMRSEAQIRKRLQKCVVWSSDDEAYVPVYNLWSRHLQNADYKNLVFSPPQTHDPKTEFNSFYGLDAEQLTLEYDYFMVDTANIKPIIEHCFYLAGGEFESMDYLMDWLAFPLQTGKKSAVAVIVKGAQGCGKNLFFSQLMGERIYGKKYYTEVAGGHQLGSQFNSHLSNKMYLVVDEPNKMSANQRNLLKNSITSATKEVQAKYQDAVVTEDYTNFVFTCNTVPDDLLEVDDRRFFVIQHNGMHVQDVEYSTRLFKAIDQYALDFYNFLKSRPLTKFKVGEAPPQTKIKERLRFQSVDPVFRYLRHLIEENQLPKFQKIPEFFDALVSWCKAQRLLKSAGWKDSLTLKKTLSEKFESHTWESPRAGHGRCICFPSASNLQNWLVEANLWYSEDESREEDAAIKVVEEKLQASQMEVEIDAEIEEAVAPIEKQLVDEMVAKFSGMEVKPGLVGSQPSQYENPLYADGSPMEEDEPETNYGAMIAARDEEKYSGLIPESDDEETVCPKSDDEELEELSEKMDSLDKAIAEEAAKMAAQHGRGRSEYVDTFDKE